MRRSLGTALRWSAVAAVVAATLSACGSSSDSSKMTVVAGENVWGSVAAAVGGKYVAVTSIVTSPSQDPHGYTASASDAAAIAKAKIVIQNGAGYDPFMSQLLAASGKSPFLVDAATILSTGGSGGPHVNPHFWYSVGRTERVARVIADVYESFDRHHKSYYEGRLRAFEAQMAQVKRIETTIKRRYGDLGVAYTERLAAYLLAESGLRVLSPVTYAKAVEDGSQPSLRDQTAMARLFSSHRARVLIYNDQTSTSVTAQARSEARHAGAQVVEMTEMLPSGVTLAVWLRHEANMLRGALAAAQRSRH